MERLKNKRIALVGGAGFIGHNLALRLRDEGAEVYVIDGFTVNNYYSVRQKETEDSNARFYLNILESRYKLLGEYEIPVKILDSRDYPAMCEMIKEIKPDCLIHLAAVSHANRSNKDPYSTFDHSLRTLENSLDICRGTDSTVEHFIYFSSSMVYGNFGGGEVYEDSVCEPIGIYGALKFAGEKMVIAYNQVFDLPYTIIRPSALYGERCISRRVGQVFIENAFSGKEIKIQGDGSDRLDFTYIQDLCSGIVNVIENKKAKGEIFNITYGQSRSIKEMAEILHQHLPGINIKYVDRDKLMPKRGTLNIDKARELIEYAPKYPLEKGYERYIKWYEGVYDHYCENTFFYKNEASQELVDANRT